MKILILGGVEKSLFDLLKFLSKTNRFDIELFLFENEGVYIEEARKMKIKINSFDKKTQTYMKPYRQNIKGMLKKFEIIKLIQYLLYIMICIFDVKYYKYSIGNKIRFRLIDNSAIKLTGYDISIAYSGRHLLYFNNKNVQSDIKYTYIHGDVCELNFAIDELKEEYYKEDKIICVSNKCKESFVKKIPELNNKCIVINNLIDFDNIDKLKLDNVDKIDHRNFNIVSVGRLSKEKNYMNLLKALKKVVNEVNITIKVYIVGDGPERKKLDKYIRKNSLENVVYLEGYQINPYKYIKYANLYIQPSISEGFCLTIYEAYYLKKIILTNNVADVKSLITNYYDGFITETDNNVDFEKKISEILNMKREKLCSMENNIKSINNNHTEKMIIKIYGGE